MGIFSVAIGRLFLKLRHQGWRRLYRSRSVFDRPTPLSTTNAVIRDKARPVVPSPEHRTPAILWRAARGSAIRTGRVEYAVSVIAEVDE